MSKSETVSQHARDVAECWIMGDVNKDKAAKLKVVADDMVLEIPFNESGRTEEGAFRRYSGKREVVEFIDAAFAAEKSVRLVSAEYVVSEDGRTVFVEARGEVEMISGKMYRNRYVLRFDVDGGKIKCLREFYNPITSAVAFGRQIAGQVTLDSL
ncbi:nuclear transport factor 2 family protein [Henriciella aquimarina]|uniref:nuclear transport factor 2 family protein n=1 Tax=Henriciella aquimarina TaxID=545261 RepID=UPI0009FBEB18|nr:nuclear transport factor 2 family protein [Henriciella aquimarina]